MWIFFFPKWGSESPWLGTMHTLNFNPNLILRKRVDFSVENLCKLKKKEKAYMGRDGTRCWDKTLRCSYYCNFVSTNPAGTLTLYAGIILWQSVSDKGIYTHFIRYTLIILVLAHFCFLISLNFVWIWMAHIQQSAGNIP